MQHKFISLLEHLALQFIYDTPKVEKNYLCMYLIFVRSNSTLHRVCSIFYTLCALHIKHCIYLENLLFMGAWKNTKESNKSVERCSRANILWRIHLRAFVVRTLLLYFNFAMKCMFIWTGWRTFYRGFWGKIC